MDAANMLREMSNYVAAKAPTLHLYKIEKNWMKKIENALHKFSLFCVSVSSYWSDQIKL